MTSQAIQGLAAALRQNGGTVSMRLMPEGLGEMRVRMRLEGTRLEATIEVTSVEARRLLSEQAGELKAALEARGLSVERLEIHAAKVLTPESELAREAARFADGGTQADARASWDGSGGGGFGGGFTGSGDERDPEQARSGPNNLNQSAAEIARTFGSSDAGLVSPVETAKLVDAVG